MMNLCSKVIINLSGKTLATAESCTGGGVGAAISAVPGASAVFKGGIISYSNWVKQHLLGVDPELLRKEGAVSAAVAEDMASGVRKSLEADIGISVTGLAGPGGDEYGNHVGTVFIGYSDTLRTISRKYLFDGDRESVRSSACREALNIILDYNTVHS